MALSSILPAIEPVIREICEVSGVAGLSYGVLHAGETYYGNFGFRDVLAKLPPDEETIYHLGSLTKFFTAATIGTLVEKGQLNWTAPVQEIIPEFQTTGNATTGKEATLLDLLSHRSGLAQKLDIWLEGENHLLLEKSDTIRTVGYLEQVLPFRSKFQYNNWNYCLAGEVMERATGESYGSLLSRQILEPLGADRTIIDANCSNPSNVAKAYIPLEDRTPWQVPHPEIQDRTLMASAGGVRSCVKDLLLIYKNLLAASTHQFSNDCTSAPESPFKQLQTIMSAHMPMSFSTLRENTYGLGWARTQLPGPLGATGYNGIFVPDMPTIKAGSTSRLVLHHQGSLPGFTSAALLFPETSSIVVVLSNSLPLNDATDWVSQLLAEHIFQTKDMTDFAKLARDSAEAHVQYCKEISRELDALKKSDGTPRPLEQYAGDYYNSIGNLRLQIKLENQELSLLFQGLSSEAYALYHLHSDTFHWHVSYNEDVKRTRFTLMDALFYQIKFGSSSGGDIDKITWAHEPDIPEGEVFMKKTQKL